MDGDKLEIVARCQLAPQLCHIYIYRAGTGGGIRVPELVHELRAGEGFLRIGEQFIKEAEFPMGQSQLLAAQVSGVFIGVHHEAADLQPARGGDPRPTQQRADAQQQFVRINGLYHVIVDARLKTPLLGANVIPRRHKQNGNFLVQTADGLRKGEAVNSRHHNIGHDKVEQLMIHGVIGFVRIQTAGGLIAAVVQKRADRAVQRSIILYDQYLKHRTSFHRRFL